MRRLHKIYRLGLLAWLLTACACAAAADEMTARAMKLYEKNHYEEAGQLLRPQLARLDSASQPAAYLTLGMIYLRSAELYQELQRTALVIEQDYLKKLGAQTGAGRSRYAAFYRGLALLEAGSFAEGAKYLQRFIGQASDSSVKKDARLALGIAYWRQKQPAQAQAQWDAIGASQPEDKAALAAAYAAAGARERNPVAMADAAVAEARKQGGAASARMNRYLLRAYSRGDAPEKALDLLAAHEFGDAAYVENLGKSKSISFYDSGLLGDVAHAHLRAAIQYLEQAARDARLSGTAAYFLADAYLLLGNAEQAQRQSAAFLAQAQMPAQYREHARARQAAAQHLAGKRQDANATWTDVLDKAANRPEPLAEVMLACMQAGAYCAKFELRAVAAADAGEGKKYFILNAALGRYYLSRKNYAKAAQYMEAGRDKANKNKIEVNDPLMLTGLAEAYYHSKKFSENLEIYFEMSKQYPAVRQIQDAMQGIYAMEQKSAGDVKIF